MAAIDGSKFKAVNARDRNYTPGKLQRRIEQIEASVERYLGSLEAADLQEGSVAQDKAARLAEKVAAMRAKVRELRALKARVEAAPDGQISLTDPDARAMATNMRGTSVVGYNVQTAAETEHHLIVAHEVTNVVIDRALLASMAARAKAAIGLTRSTCWPTAVISAASRSGRAKQSGRRRARLLRTRIFLF